MKVDLKKLLAKRKLRFADLARVEGVDKSTVTRWADRRVPAERVLAIEAKTGISRHDLRPDIYGSETPSSPEAAA
jgi:DNA-binding transcriptional regulator YdaS (Cro superfamily)